MRNDYIGTSIDGDARAACPCRNSSSNTSNSHQSCNSCQGRVASTCSCNSCQGRVTSTCSCQSCNHRTNCNRSNDRDNDCSRQTRTSCECNDDCRQSRSNCDNDCSRQSRTSCDNDCSSRQRSCNDECSCNGRQRSCGDDCSCNGRTPAMVYAQHHDLDNMYCAEMALNRGTLFGCLDKPMCGERCTDNACTTQCQEDKFSIWELRLYLNTHPCDQQALALLRKLTEQMDDDCGCTFTSDCNRWSWLDGPWPWEYQRCCGKEA